MPNAKDIPIDFRLFALFVGVYDSGKSTAAASFPGRKFFYDFDGRIASLRGREDVDFSSYVDTSRGFEDADKELEMMIVKSRANQLPYSMVCMDSLSTMRNFLIYDAMKYTSGIDEKTKKVRGRKIGPLYLPTLQDYGYEAEGIRQLVWEGLKKLKCHVVVTGHVVDEFKTIQSADGAPAERVKVGDKIYGDPNLLAVLPICFTEVYKFTKEDNPFQRPGEPKVRRFVEFTGDVARTTYPQLAEVGRVEITGKDFYDVWYELIGGKNGK